MHHSEGQLCPAWGGRYPVHGIIALSPPFPIAICLTGLHVNDLYDRTNHGSNEEFCSWAAFGCGLGSLSGKSTRAGSLFVGLTMRRGKSPFTGLYRSEISVT